MFSYVHSVMVCHTGRSSIVPGIFAQERHLRAASHRLLGDMLKATVQISSDYKPNTLEQLNDETPQLKDECLAH